MKFRRFLKIWLAIVLLGAASTLTVGIVVDPYDLFQVVSVKGFNEAKPERGYNRLVRSVELCRVEYDTIFLGTSRILVGIDPRSRWLDGRNTYNAGLGMSTVYEIGKVADYIRKCNKPKRIILGIDFFTFSPNRTVMRDFAESKFSGSISLETYMSRTLTAKAISDAYATVRANLKNPAMLDDLGYEDKSSRKIDHRTAFRKTLTNFMSKDWSYGGFSYSYERVTRFRDYVARLVESDIRVFIFMSPIHAQQMNTIKQLELFGDFEQWKRDVLQVIKEINGANPAMNSVELWDFSNFNSVTMEPVPAAGSQTRMTWFYESSHYTPRTGNFVLLRLLHPETASTIVPRDFGVDLTEVDIEAYLSEIRAAQVVYEKIFPEDVEEISRMVSETAPKRALLARFGNEGSGG